MESNGKRITLKDIARRAETSTMAVSVVLNGARSNTRVADATRRRITEIAANLNYTPNAMARGLRRQRTNTLGVLFNWAGGTAIHNLYSVGVLDGIVAGAAEAGYHVLLYTHSWRNAEVSAAAFSDQRTDGVIVVAPDEDSDVIPGLVGLGLSVSIISAVTAATGVPYITIDNRKGVRLALDHLWELGHRRIAYLGPARTRHSPRERHEAYIDWMAERGLPLPDPEMASRYNLSDQYTALYESLDNAHSRATAILTFNDDVAVEVSEMARSKGLTLPDDLSVVGFDDVLIASLTTPKLTTVRLPLFEMGRVGAKLLVARIEGSDKIGFDPAHILIPELIVRNSTAPPAKP